jgi:hypothetical protein
VHELRLYSPEVLQIRKEEIEGMDSIGGSFGRRRCRRLEEGGSLDTRARDVSERQRGEGKRSLAHVS